MCHVLISGQSRIHTCTYKYVCIDIRTCIHYIPLLSIYVLGGEILRGFSFAMILGVIVGTYSSIFVASPLLKYLKVTSKTMDKSEEKILP